MVLHRWAQELGTNALRSRRWKIGGQVWQERIWQWWLYRKNPTFRPEEDKKGGFTNANVKLTLGRAYFADTSLKFRRWVKIGAAFTLQCTFYTPLNLRQVKMRSATTECIAEFFLQLNLKFQSSRRKFLLQMQLYQYKNLRSSSGCERRTQKRIFDFISIFITIGETSVFHPSPPPIIITTVS